MTIPMTATDYMQLALSLAEKGQGNTSPNPMVGCVIVRDAKIVGQGWHQRAGEPHAEIMALQQAQEQARGATAYVTLEPCCHHGRTPPCTDALIAAGLATVVIACQDPNPRVAGGGIQALRNAGIAVELGLCETQARHLNRFFLHYICNQRPYTLLKWAMSLDGKMITHPQDSRQITTAEALEHAHGVRHQVDAILVGAQTARLDNPHLTVRSRGLIDNNHNNSPKRIVICTHGNIPTNLHIFCDDLRKNTIVATTQQAPLTWVKTLEQQGVTLVILPMDENNQVSLAHLLDWLGQQQLISLLVEGGPTLLQRFFALDLFQELHTYLAPTVIGPWPHKRAVTITQSTQLGNNYFFASTA